MRVLPAEYDIVCQMQVIDREVFFYLCQRTDNKTGVVGHSVRVSRSGMALDLSERMTPGKRGAVWVVTSDGVKNSIDRLVECGLFKRLSVAGKGSALVLERVFLAGFLAERQSAQKQVTRRLPDRLPDINQNSNNNINELQENNQTGSPVNFAEVTRTNINNINNNTRVDNRIDGQAFAMRLDWQPTENELRALLFRAGGSQYRIEDIDPAWVSNFVGYWFGMPGRLQSQQQWTAKLAAQVIKYFRSPGLFDQLNGVRSPDAHKKPYDVGSKSLPDWARLPRNDDELVAWARRNGYGEADRGDGLTEFKAKLRVKINKRLEDNNLAKVSW